MNNATKRRKKSDAKYLLREPELISRLSEEDKRLMYLYRDYCQNTNINDLEGEVWYDVPEWVGYYQISNYIRLKSVRYNEIRKPRINYKHYFDTSFHKEGKAKYLIYSRLVAIVFHSNPNNLPEVNHINGIRWDNRPSNLEWSTSKENIGHSISVLGNSKGEVEIVQLTLFGCFIRVWASIAQAAKEVNGTAANITTTCKGRNAYAYGYRWMYKDEYELNGVRNQKFYESHKSVIQYDLNGSFIKEWSSMKEAADNLNLTVGRISVCCKNKVKRAGIYLWEYKNI